MKRFKRHFAICLLFSFALLLASGCLVGGPPEESFGETEIEYFMTVAMGVEFGESDNRVRKWTKDLRIEVSGDPTDEDRATLDQVVADLNDLQDQVRLGLVDEKPNVEMTFAPESEFSKLEPNYQPTNYGFFWVNWDSKGAIYRARILISSDKVEQKERSHLIREELTQSLGLMRDSIKYQDSIFYANRSEVSRYADIDKALIKLLYMDGIEPDMTEKQVREVLEDLKSSD